MKVKIRIKRYLGSAHRSLRMIDIGARRLKPYMDILSPLVLIFVAFKAAEISQQQAEIQREQTEYQHSQAQPVLEIRYFDEFPTESHKDARIEIKNHGGPMFEVTTIIRQALDISIEMPSGSGSGWISYNGNDFGRSFESDPNSPVRKSNVYWSKDIDSHPISAYLNKVGQILPGGTMIDRGYILRAWPAFLLSIQWKKMSGEIAKDIYLIERSVTREIKEPEWSRIDIDKRTLSRVLSDYIERVEKSAQGGKRLLGR